MPALDGHLFPFPSLILRSAVAEARTIMDAAGNTKLVKAGSGRRRSARDDAVAAAIIAVAVARRAANRPAVRPAHVWRGPRERGPPHQGMAPSTPPSAHQGPAHVPGLPPPGACTVSRSTTSSTCRMVGPTTWRTCLPSATTATGRAMPAWDAGGYP